LVRRFETGKASWPSPFSFFSLRFSSLHFLVFLRATRKASSESADELGLAGGVVFYVDRVEHCCCGGVGFFVGGDFFFVLETGAYVVQAF
jgi:hypothetical protein